MNVNNKIVTVFGGSGFLGTYVVRELAERGYRIKIICRNPELSKPLKVAGYVGQVTAIKGDISENDLSSYLKNSYAAVNLVGILSESGSQKFGKLQCDSAGNLAKAAMQCNVEKFVQISAIVNASSKAEYAKSKLAGEQAVLAAFPEATIIRPSVIFGAEDNFFNMFAKMSTVSPFLPLIGGGHTKFQPVYVGDVAAVIKKVVDGEVATGTYELGGPEVLSFKQILQRVMKYTGRKRYFSNLPFSLAEAISPLMPSFLLTGDQVKLLKHDNIVQKSAKGFDSLNIIPTPIDAIVPKYLERFKKRQLKLAN